MKRLKGRDRESHQKAAAGRTFCSADVGSFSFFFVSLRGMWGSSLAAARACQAAVVQRLSALSSDRWAAARSYSCDGQYAATPVPAAAPPLTFPSTSADRRACARLVADTAALVDVGGCHQVLLQVHGSPSHSPVQENLCKNWFYFILFYLMNLIFYIYSITLFCSFTLKHRWANFLTGGLQWLLEGRSRSR